MATARTVTQVIQSSLRKLGVLAAGETVNDNDTSTGLEALQDIVSELGMKNITIPSTSDESITLVSEQSEYTIGDALESPADQPDLDTTRPEQIISAYIRDSSGYDYPVEIFSKAQYDSILDKDLAGRPSALYYNPTAPYGTAYLWTVPDTEETLHFVSFKPLTDPASLSEDLLITTGIPRGYHNVLKWILVCDLAPEYGIQPTQFMILRREEGKNAIEVLNMANRIAPVNLEITQAQSIQRRTILSF